MLVDARLLPPGHNITADLCIVGAGVAGLTLAREFLNRPFTVCVLESGGFSGERSTQTLCQGENVGLPYVLDRVRLREIGGTSNAWVHSLGWGSLRLGARYRPLDEVDFEKREGVPYSGWPFKKSHLDPYYGRAEEVFELGPYSYDIDEWESLGASPCFPFQGREIKTVVFKIGPRDPFTTKYPRQLASACNTMLVHHANVLEIETDEWAQRVSTLRVACLDGKEFQVTARVFVLANGGIEAPRLLLLSTGNRSIGLGNGNDLVGRFFMEHLHFVLGRFLPSSSRVRRYATGYRTYTVRGKRILGQLAPAEDVIRREHLLNACLGLTPDVPRLASESSVGGIESLSVLRSALYGGHKPKDIAVHLGNIAKDAPVMARRTVQKSWRRVASIAAAKVFRFGHMAEQSPNPNSRVTLSSERDLFGLRQVRLNWQLQGHDLWSVARIHEILHANFVRASLGRLEIDRYDELPAPRVLGGHHHMGTTRMHPDAKQGVVDEQCRVHGVSNLYVAGPSVFPTSGYANPSLTIGALAIRLADHIANRLKTWGTGEHPTHPSSVALATAEPGGTA